MDCQGTSTPQQPSRAMQFAPSAPRDAGISHLLSGIGSRELLRAKGCCCPTCPYCFPFRHQHCYQCHNTIFHSENRDPVTQKDPVTREMRISCPVNIFPCKSIPSQSTLVSPLVSSISQPPCSRICQHVMMCIPTATHEIQALSEVSPTPLDSEFCRRRSRGVSFVDNAEPTPRRPWSVLAGHGLDGEHVMHTQQSPHRVHISCSPKPTWRDRILASVRGLMGNSSPPLPRCLN